MSSSVERRDDPEGFAAGLDELAGEVWARVARNLFELQDSKCELRLTRSDGGRVLAVSRADFDGDVIRRALVIAPEFQGSAASLELTRAELEAFFSRGVRAVEYRIHVAHAVAHGRVRVLGAERVPQADTVSHHTYRLTADDFAARQASLLAAMQRRTQCKRS